MFLGGCCSAEDHVCSRSADRTSVVPARCGHGADTVRARRGHGAGAARVSAALVTPHNTNFCTNFVTTFNVMIVLNVFCENVPQILAEKLYLRNFFALLFSFN